MPTKYDKDRRCTRNKEIASIAFLNTGGALDPTSFNALKWVTNEEVEVTFLGENIKRSIFKGVIPSAMKLDDR